MSGISFKHKLINDVCVMAFIHNKTAHKILVHFSYTQMPQMSRDMRFPTMWYVRPRRLRPTCAYAQSDHSLCWSLVYSMTVKLLAEQHLEFLSLKVGCTGSSESTLVKLSHCLKFHVAVQINSFTLTFQGGGEDWSYFVNSTAKTVHMQRLV